MMVHSLRLNKILRSRKGYATLVATIIMVMVVMFLFYNVYLFKLRSDADYQNAISRSQQLDGDQASEKLTVLNAAATNGGTDAVIISCTLINDSHIPIQIVRLWLVDVTLPSSNTANVTLNLVLQPGARAFRSFLVTLPGAQFLHSFSARFVTSRANQVAARIN